MKSRPGISDNKHLYMVLQKESKVLKTEYSSYPLLKNVREDSKNRRINQIPYI